MEFKTFDIDGPLEVTPKKFGDDRGYFSEIFRHDAFCSHAGQVDFVQENQSFSARAGTIRGLHFQSDPFAQGKLVRCMSGSIFDVAVDIRQGSPHYGKWVATELTADKNNQLWVPAGFAHGFCTLTPDVVVAYKVTAYYSAECDKGVAWNDPDIGLIWPEIADEQTLSPKDRVQPSLGELPKYFTTQGAS